MRIVTIHTEEQKTYQIWPCPPLSPQEKWFSRVAKLEEARKKLELEKKDENKPEDQASDSKDLKD
ncbi:MAG: hypothetical protein ACXVNM_01555 [Bacteroidia bacterium]